MPRTTAILGINAQHFTVRLYETMLEIDLTENIRNEIVEALENKSVLRETAGTILGMFVPLHIRTSDIDSVQTEETGIVRIVLPHHRDIIIPLKPDEAKKLVNKLNELIPKEKRKELLRLIEEVKKIIENRI